MKMGNVAKEPRMSDLLFSIDMERREDDISAMLDCLPDELENAFSDIDVNFFLGNRDSIGSIDSIGDDIISLSSYDSDEFEKLLNEDKFKNKSQQVKDKKKDNKKGKNNIIPHKVATTKKEVPEPKEIFKVSNDKKNYPVKEEISVTDRSDAESFSEDKEDYNYTFYVAPVKKKKRKKRKDPEYCKKKRSKSEKNLKIVIKRKERQTELSKPTLNSVSDFHSSAANSPPLTNQSSPPSSHNLLDFAFCDIPFNDSFSLSIAEKVKTERRCRVNSSEINGSSGDRKEERIAKKHKKIMRANNNKTMPSIKSISFATPNQIKSEVETSTNESNSINLRTHKNTSNEVSNGVPSSHRLISSNDKLRFKDKCNSFRSTVLNNKVVSPKSKNFHDYSKQLPLDRNCDESKKELLRKFPALLPINSKDITKRECNQNALRVSLRRNSSESDKETSNAQESFDIPVSMAEVEVSSFEDAVEIPAEPKITYNIRLNSHPDSFPSLMQTKFPIVLLTPLNSKKMNSENFKVCYSAERENSAPLNSSSNLFSQLNKSQRVSIKSNSGLDSIRSNQHLKRSEKKSSLPSSPVVSKQLCSELHSKNHSSVSLRPSTRSHTKSPEPKKTQNNSKFKREVDQRLTREEKEDEERRLNFDNRKAIEERRVMYVGKIPAYFTDVNLHDQFSRFGEIENIQIKTKESESQTECRSVFDHEYGDWNISSSQKLKVTFGFITFKRQADVAKAIEEGKKLWPELTINYGGRREFVKVSYSDLDGNFADEIGTDYGYSSKKDDDFDFARELKAAQQRRGLTQFKMEPNSQHSYDLKGA